MFIVYLLLNLFQQYGTIAAPVRPASEALSHDMPIFNRADSPAPDTGRTVWNILWSCLATTFSVTWVSVHPNVPFLEETNWMVMKRRIFLMVLALLAPELMIMWAFKQWRGAVMIKEIVNRARPESCTARSRWVDIVLVSDFLFHHSARVDNKARLLPSNGWVQAGMYGERKGRVGG